MCPLFAAKETSLKLSLSLSLWIVAILFRETSLTGTENEIKNG